MARSVSAPRKKMLVVGASGVIGRAAVDFALKFATDHQSITEADKRALREHFTSQQIVELALLCIMCLVGRFSNIVGLLEDGSS